MELTRQNEIDIGRLETALTWACRMSRDPKWKVGAILVHPDNRQLSMGYNGLVKGVAEMSENWMTPKKEIYIRHAEINAIMWAPFHKDACTLYCTLRPCIHCLGTAINVGIKRIVYIEWKESANEKHYGKEWNELARMIKVDTYYEHCYNAHFRDIISRYFTKEKTNE